MLELAPVRATVILCAGNGDDLDGVPAVLGSVRCRVARDEVLCLGPSTARQELLAEAAFHLAAADPPGLAVDQTDGWAVWRITGDQREQALARLGGFKVPRSRPAFVQGVIAQVPAKVLLESEAIHILVRTPVSDYLSTRILEACRDLDTRYGEPIELALESAVVAAGTSGVRTPKEVW